MRFVCDIDNVILDWQGTWAKLYQLWYGTEITDVQLEEWDACLKYTRFENMGEFYRWFEDAFGWLDVSKNPVPGALGGLDDAGQICQTVLCTSRPEVGQIEASALARHLPGRPHVYFRNNTSKHLVPGGSVWLDDAPEVLTSLVENGKLAIRFDRPWNRKLPKKIEKELLVARDWDEVLVHLHALKEAA